VKRRKAWVPLGELARSNEAQLLERCADQSHVQELIGHASVESTQVYTQVDVRNLKDTLASCHPRERAGIPVEGLAVTPARRRACYA